VTITAEAAFEQALEIFRKEEETAQQHFFAYLSVRDDQVCRARGPRPWHHRAKLAATLGHNALAIVAPNIARQLRNLEILSCLKAD
jgi:hypothetical protein